MSYEDNAGAGGGLHDHHYHRHRQAGAAAAGQEDHLPAQKKRESLVQFISEKQIAYMGVPSSLIDAKNAARQCFNLRRVKAEDLQLSVQMSARKYAILYDEAAYCTVTYSDSDICVVKVEIAPRGTSIATATATASSRTASAASGFRYTTASASTSGNRPSHTGVPASSTASGSSSSASGSSSPGPSRSSQSGSSAGAHRHAPYVVPPPLAASLLNRLTAARASSSSSSSASSSSSRHRAQATLGTAAPPRDSATPAFVHRRGLRSLSTSPEDRKPDVSELLRNSTGSYSGVSGDRASSSRLGTTSFATTDGSATSHAASSPAAAAAANTIVKTEHITRLWVCSSDGSVEEHTGLPENFNFGKLRRMLARERCIAPDRLELKFNDDILSDIHIPSDFDIIEGQMIDYRVVPPRVKREEDL